MKRNRVRVHSRPRGLRSQAVIASVLAVFIGGQIASATPADVFDYPAPAPGAEPEKTRDLADGEYAVATQTGSFSYNFAIEVPPGRHVQPTLSLSYSSQGAPRGGVASGWTLPIPELTVDTTDGRLIEQDPSYVPIWVSSMAGGQRLIAETDGSNGMYRAQYDTSFTRYRKLPDGSAWMWEARTPDGMFYTFGETDMMEATEERRAPLTRVVDRHGNTAEYYWKSVFDGPDLVDVVIDRIEYTSNEAAVLNAHAKVVFLYDDTAAPCAGSSINPGAQLTYRDGKRRIRGQLPLDAIETYVRTTQTGTFIRARRIDLTYDSAARSCGAGHGPRRLLQSIQETAYDSLGADTSLPPITFSYGALSPSFDNVAKTLEPSTFPTDPQGLGSGLRYVDARWPTLDEKYLDLDGDGRVDRLTTLLNGSQCELWMQAQVAGPGGTISLGSPEFVMDLPLLPWEQASGPTTSERCSLAGQFTFYSNTEPDPVGPCPDADPIGSYNAYRFMDYDGDGLPDLFTSYIADPQYFDPSLYAPWGSCSPEYTVPPCVDLVTQCMNDPDCAAQGTYCANPALYPTCMSTAAPVDCGAMYLECLECGTGPGDPPPPSDPCERDWRQEQRACDRYVLRIYKNLGRNGSGTMQFDSSATGVLSPVKLESDGGDSSLGGGGGTWGFSSQAHGFTDLDGDGHLDAMVRSKPSGAPDVRIWEVFRGDGTGQFLGLSGVVGGIAGDYAYHWSSPTGLLGSWGSNLSGSGSGTVLAHQSPMDVNGDGLVDIVRSIQENTDSEGFVTLTIVETEAFYNNGAGFDGVSSWLSPEPLDDILRLSESYIEVISGTPTPQHAIRTDHIRLLDFDGDGLLDRFVREDTECFGGPAPAVRFGTGDQLTPQECFPSGWLEYIERSANADGAWATSIYEESSNIWALYTDVMDFDGDGRLDQVVYSPDISGPDQIEVYPALDDGHPAGLLWKIENGQGGTIQVSYGSSVNRDLVPQGDMPRSTWLVDELKVDPGFGRTQSTTSYEYLDPEYNNLGPDGRWGFRGFHEVRATGPRGAVTASKFGYDVDWSGREIETTVYAGPGLAEPRRTTSTTWISQTLFGGKITTFHPDETLERVCQNGQTLAQCLTEPVRRTARTWAPVAGVTGYIANTETLDGEGLSLADGYRRDRVVDWETRDPAVISEADMYFVGPKITEDHERVGGAWAETGWQKLDYDLTYLDVLLEHTKLDAAGRIATSETRYDAATGNVTKEITPRYAGTETGTDYLYLDAHELQDVRITDAKGNRSYRYHDVATGALTQQLGPHFYTVWVPCGFYLCPSYVWQTEQWTIDPFGRPLERWVSNPDDTDTLTKIGTYEYFDFESPVRTRTQTAIRYNSTYWLRTTDETFDGIGLPDEVRVALDDGNDVAAGTADWAITSFEYEHGDLKTFSPPDPSDDIGSVTYEYRYDSIGRPTGAVNPNGTGVAMSYDGRATTRFDAIDSGGTLIPTTDGSGSTTTTVADVFGRLAQVTEYDSVAGNGVSTYEYDADDNLSRVIDADNVVTELDHNYVGWREAITRDVGGATERLWQYQYDVNGNTEARISPVPGGQPSADYTTTFTYDELDRVLTKVPGTRGYGTTYLNWFYGGTAVADRTTTYFYDDISHEARGRLWRVELPHGAIEYQYDWRGAIASESREVDMRNPITGGNFTSGPYTISYDLNAMSGPEYTTYPDGLLAYHSYDFRGNVLDSWIETGSLGWKRMASDTRNRAGLITLRQSDASSGANQHRTIGYDQLGRPISDYVYYNGTSLRARYNPQYNQAGDVAVLNTIYGTTGYCYDERRQLEQVGGPNSCLQTAPYGYRADLSYHKNGRIQSADITWSPTGPGIPPAFPRNVNYHYGAADPDAPDKITDVGTGATEMQFLYDASGNMKLRMDPSVTSSRRYMYYDDEDRLRRVFSYAAGYPQEFYYYDHDHQRMLRVDDDGDTYLKFGDLELQLDTTGAELPCGRRKYLRAGALPIAELKGDDGLGCEELRVNYHAGRGDILVSLAASGGAVLARFEYGPFGEITHSYGTATVGDTQRRFNNKDYDWESGLHYYGYRYYDPFSLTWNRADPLYRFAPDIAFDEPRRMNLYAFSLNNPVRYVDADGRNPLAEAADATRSACGSNPGACAGAAVALVAAAPEIIVAGVVGASLGAAFSEVGMRNNYEEKTEAYRNYMEEKENRQRFQDVTSDLNAASTKAAEEGSAAGRDTNVQMAAKEDGAATTNDNAKGEESFAADENGNVLPVPEGGSTGSSPDGKWVQVKDRNGKPTGTRIDNGHSGPNHKDERSRKPHAHIPGKTNEDGTPWLPVKQ